MVLFGLSLSICTSAQIGTSKINFDVEKKQTKYDSSTNFLGDDVLAYKGQELYLQGVSETLQKYGYSDFLNDYQKSYTFKNYDSQFKNFINICTNLSKSFDKIASNTNKNDLNLINDIEQFLQNASQFENLSSAIAGYLDEMKSIGGKTFDMVKDFGFTVKTV